MAEECVEVYRRHTVPDSGSLRILLGLHQRFICSSGGPGTAGAMREIRSRELGKSGPCCNFQGKLFSMSCDLHWHRQLYRASYRARSTVVVGAALATRLTMDGPVKLPVTRGLSSAATRSGRSHAPDTLILSVVTLCNERISRGST